MMILIYNPYLTGGEITGKTDKWTRWVFSSFIALGVMYQVRAIAEEVAISEYQLPPLSNVSYSHTFSKQ